MKTFSSDVISKADFDDVNVKQTQQIKKLRIALIGGVVLNALFTIVLFLVV